MDRTFPRAALNFALEWLVRACTKRGRECTKFKRTWHALVLCFDTMQGPQREPEKSQYWFWNRAKRGPRHLFAYTPARQSQQVCTRGTGPRQKSNKFRILPAYLGPNLEKKAGHANMFSKHSTLLCTKFSAASRKVNPMQKLHWRQRGKEALRFYKPSKIYNSTNLQIKISKKTSSSNSTILQI